ncbi:hypothetical protein [Bradyrhizobium viridifuturi]|uniref:hypothetical protein n=1 Tax=Bradyrhizobium viridifuturi TaxID=1654716 RepID=UPI0012FF3D6F|nr:hypothetical protein [Bradyrhizobium viridifuturi]
MPDKLVGIARQGFEIPDVDIVRIDVGVEVERPMSIGFDQEVVARFLGRELAGLDLLDELMQCNPFCHLGHSPTKAVSKGWFDPGALFGKPKVVRARGRR